MANAQPKSDAKPAPRRRAAPKRSAPAARTGMPLAATFMGPDGSVSVDQIASTFGMSKAQLAETTGLGRDSLSKTARQSAPKTRARLTEMLEIIGRVQAWAGGHAQAMAWYRAQPIPALGDRTAEHLVKSGKAGLVRDYLDHLALGGFA